MDPDVTAVAIKELIERMNTRPLTPDELEEVTELISALNAWIDRGGYAPAIWHTNSN